MSRQMPVSGEWDSFTSSKCYISKELRSRKKYIVCYKVNNGYKISFSRCLRKVHQI